MRQVCLPLALLLALPAVACSGGESGGEKSVEVSKAPAKAPPVRAPEPEKPGVRPDGSVVSAVQWFQGTLEQAMARAAEEGKLVFVDVGAYWCPPCHELDELTFVDAGVGEALSKGFIALHIDAEKGEGPEIVDRYHVQAYPTLMVLEANGVEKGRLVDFMGPDELVAALDRLARGGNALAALEAEVEAHPDDLEKRYELGNNYALAANREKAEEAFEAVLLGDPKNEMGLAVKIAYDRAQFVTEKLDRDYDKAIREYRTLQRKYPGTNQALRAHRKIARALHRLGKDDEAIESVLKMVEADPEDVAMHANVGWFSFRNKVKPERALETVEAGLKLEPDNAELHYLAAELRHLTGDGDGALASIRKASEAEPKSNYYKRQVRRFELLAAGAPDPAGAP